MHFLHLHGFLSLAPLIVGEEWRYVQHIVAGTGVLLANADF